MAQPATDGSKKARILLVDDEQSILETSTMMLELLGYQVTGLNTTDAALATIESGEEFDLVLTDLDMPKHDGREFARLAREKGLTAPVVVVSGYVLDESEWKPDFDGMLMKPFRIQDLQDKIGELLT